MPDRIQIRAIARMSGETWAVAIPRVDAHGIDGGTITTSTRTAAVGLAHLVTGYLDVPAEVWDDGVPDGRWVCAHPTGPGTCDGPTPCAEHQPNPEPSQEQP